MIQNNPVHILTPRFFEIHFNIILMFSLLRPSVLYLFLETIPTVGYTKFYNLTASFLTILTL